MGSRRRGRREQPPARPPPSTLTLPTGVTLGLTSCLDTGPNVSGVHARESYTPSSGSGLPMLSVAPCLRGMGRARGPRGPGGAPGAVSYTHLTLPTICSV
eukprot:5877634-Alexandrium_andersonii.AAC.1